MLPDGHDPDSLVRQEGAEAFRTRIMEAQPFSDYFFESLEVGLDLGSIEGRAALTAKAGPFLEKIHPGVFREMLQERLSQLTGRLEGGFQVRRPGVMNSLPKAAKGQPSAFRTFMALLVQYPALVDHLDTQALGLLVNGQPQGALLQVVVEFLMSHPHVTSAGLIEGLRGLPEGDLVARLAAWDTQVVEEQAEPTFLDYLRHLTGSRTRESRLKNLIDRARSGTLTLEEREELRALTLQGGE